jgi:hypothetical protein
LFLKNNNGLWTVVKLGSCHDIACTADNMRADSHLSSAPNELEHRPDEGTPRPIELIELRHGKSSAAWSPYSSRIRPSILGSPHGL